MSSFLVLKNYNSLSESFSKVSWSLFCHACDRFKNNYHVYFCGPHKTPKEKAFPISKSSIISKHTHTHTHTHARARTHAHTHTLDIFSRQIWVICSSFFFFFRSGLFKSTRQFLPQILGSKRFRAVETFTVTEKSGTASAKWCNSFPGARRWVHSEEGNVGQNRRYRFPGHCPLTLFYLLAIWREGGIDVIRLAGRCCGRLQFH